MANLPHISILGPGKVGTALAVLAGRAGWPLRAVGGRSLARARRAAKAILRLSGCVGKSDPPRTGKPARGSKLTPPGPLGGSALLVSSSADAARAAGPGDIILLTVSDDAIESVCRQLALNRAFRPGAIVAHCSGALGSDVLAPAKACGCHVGSLHPCQTFPTVAAAVAALPGTYCFIEGDAPAARALARLARAIGGRPVRIAPRAKTLYHAAACAASNYLVALMDFALELGEAGGVGRGKLLPALAPLIRATVENVVRFGPAAALTGPIARGDARTVGAHLNAIRLAATRRGARVPAATSSDALPFGSPPNKRSQPRHSGSAVASRPSGADLTSLYAALAQRTLQLARRKGTLSPAAARAVKDLIREYASVLSASFLWVPCPYESSRRGMSARRHALPRRRVRAWPLRAIRRHGTHKI